MAVKAKKTKPRSASNLDQRLIKALGHPVRDRILRVLMDNGDASPKQAAKRLRLPLQNVAYHFKILEECEAIELVDTAQRRGATEHFYRAIARPFMDDATWAKLPLAARRSIYGTSLQHIWDDVGAAADAGGFDDPRNMVAYTNLDLDQQAYDELAKLLGELLDRAMELPAEVAERRINGEIAEDDARRTEIVLLHFDRPAK